MWLTDITLPDITFYRAMILLYKNQIKILKLLQTLVSINVGNQNKTETN